MNLASDIRYFSYDDDTLAVVFDGRCFSAYRVGQETVGLTITMEMLSGVYPEVIGQHLTRIETKDVAGRDYGIWKLDEDAASNSKVGEVRSWLNLQERTRKAMQEHCGNRDIVHTLESTVERLDDLLTKSKQPSAWAEVLLPVLTAASDAGVSMDEILTAGYKKVRWLEKQINNKDD